MPDQPDAASAAPEALPPSDVDGAAEGKPDGWALALNPDGHRCAQCGVHQHMLQIGRRRESRGWSDVPGERLCLRCFATRMTERRPPQRATELDGRFFPWSR